MAAFGKGEETIWEWAWFRVTEESVGNGLTIAAADARLCHIRSLVYVNNRFDAVYYEPDSSMQIVA